jgi:hypothetical protein
MRAARRVRFAAAVLCAWIACAEAAPFPYDADVERFGTAIAAPLGRRDGVRKAMEYCGGTFPDLGWSAYPAYGQWVRRHGAFLQLTIAMRRALETAAEKESSPERARWERIDDDLPRVAEDLSAGLLHGISSLTSPEEKRRACAETIASVASRKLDLDAVEPAVAKYLREISGKFRIALPAPGADVTAPGAGARTDAQALVGKWTTEKIRYYLSDGRIGEDDAQCTLDFSGKALVSECQVSGRQVKVVSAYEVRAPGRYETTVTENALYPDMVGARDVTMFRVENGKLVTSSYLPIASADPMRPVEIEAILSPGVLSGRRPR